VKRQTFHDQETADPNYRILAARSLRKQVKQLTEHLGGVRRCEQVESVHRARVASRRLRAALGMFRSCFSHKQVRLWKKHIRRLAQHLGEARDHDVLIEFLVARLASISEPALVPGVAALLNRAEQERKWIQPRVVKAMDRFERTGVLKSLQTMARSSLAGAEATELAVGPPFPVSVAATQRVPRQAARFLRRRLKHLHAEAAGLSDPGHFEQHHAMRVAAKRLRYALELARPLYPGDLIDANEAIRKLQTLLGEVHDCDVWVAAFEEFVRWESGEIRLPHRRKKAGGTALPVERLLPGLDYLRQERTERRREVFDDLAAFWQALKEGGVWDRLETLLEKGGSGMEPEKDIHPSLAEATP
jgi:CHAD domain-containing protein